MRATDLLIRVSNGLLCISPVNHTDTDSFCYEIISTIHDTVYRINVKELLLTDVCQQPKVGKVANDRSQFAMPS